jgi:flagellar biosynthesis protein FliQ
MTPETVMTIARSALELTLVVSAPLLLAALGMGLIISLFQAATQINEMTLSFIPKLVAMIAALAIFGPWMIQIMVDYLRQTLENLPWMIG